MDVRLHVDFCYKDGKEYQMFIDIPAEVAAKIQVGGLIATRVFIEAKISNIAAGLKKPQFNDFKKIN